MTRIKQLITWFSLAWLLALAGCQQDSVRPERILLKLGDQPEWAALDWNDQDWEATNGTSHQELFWLRFHMRLDSTVTRQKPLGVKVVALGSFDAFWDGRLIGHNGQVGRTKATERPGKHATYWLLPDTDTKPGVHVLALRVSNFYARTGYSFYNCSLDNYPDMVRASVQTIAWMAMLAGAFLIGAIYYLFLSLHNRREPLFWLFSLICGLFFCLIIAEYLPLIWSYQYDVQTPRLEVIGVLTLSISLLVPSFLNRQFALFNPTRFTLPLLLLLLGIYVNFHGRYDFTAQLMSLTMGISALLLALLAVHQQRKGALSILISVGLSGLLACFLYYDYSLYLSFGFLLLAMLYGLVIRSREIDQAYQQTLLLSERLKTELLKKSIQPHFLLNTLTSLIDWIEESPKQGVVFIEALASEFKLLNQMVDVRLVAITHEIELCKSHLVVMRFRKEIHYVWDDFDIDLRDTLPPALLHTALENGITHSLPLADGTIRFQLYFQRTNVYRQYQLRTIATNRIVGKEPEKGTGLPYMRARLTESYGNNWTLLSQESDEGWLTQITIYENSNH
ncbi:regulator [Spirosoma sp. HMF4905]|uniref:Regulator n=1 Tax=Spirosoma arboris TaxID=2682092 RepID=A0A7K1SKI1_9BACT|nr:sensor histidine kinase [Spirosoma arboris]MVM34106.1 regulator [Spirosoma arboris]